MNINLSDIGSSVDFKNLLMQNLSDSVSFHFIPPTQLNVNDTASSVVFTNMTLQGLSESMQVELKPPMSLQFTDTTGTVVFNEITLGELEDGTAIKVVHPIKLILQDTFESIDFPDISLQELEDLVEVRLDQSIGVNILSSGVRFILSNRAHTLRGEIRNIETDSIHIASELVNGNSIAFDVYKYLDGEEDPLYDEIVDLKLVYVPELHDFFEITITDYDTVKQRKSVQGVSAGIAELSQTILYGFEVNTEADIARDDYVVTKFYNIDNAKASLLHRVLYKLPQYTIGEVPDQLCNIQRTFSANGTSVWEFLSNTVAEEINCIFQIDNIHKIINVRDMMVYCEDCRKRVEPYFEKKPIVVDDEDNTEIIRIMKCPKCGGTYLTYYGDDTTMLVNKEIFTDEVQLTMDADAIKNTLRLEAGDDLMTATIQSLNPNGMAYITRFDEYQLEDMPTELVERLESYAELYDQYQAQYAQDVYGLYEAIDNYLLYKSGLMPALPQDPVTSATEAAKLVPANLSPMSLSKVTSSTSVASVSSALKLYAAVYVKTGYVKVEVVEGATFTFYGEDQQGHNYGIWRGAFKVTNYSDENDTTTTNVMSITVNDAYEDFLKQKIAKQIVKYDDKEGNIFNVLNITDLDDFKEALTYYCVNRLTSFRDAIQGCIDILVQEQQAQVVKEFYTQIYLPYFNKLVACEAEIGRRQSGIEPDGSPAAGYETKNVDYWDRQRTAYEKEIRSIQEILNFENYLGPDLYKIYCAYRREDTYTNSNFSSDGLTNTELFEKAEEYLELANQELMKASTPQYTISCDLYNLLKLAGYEEITYDFLIGNFIRVEADGRIFRLRLIEIDVDYSDLNKVDVKFSTVTQVGGIMSDIQSVISSARSMATSYGSVQHQAEYAVKTSNDVNNFVETGLLSAMGTLKNNEDENIIINEYGLMAKTRTDDGQSFDPEQVRITHNLIAFTDDGWATATAALGKHDYQTWDDAERAFITKTDFGLTAQFVTAGQVNGSQMIGGNIYSSNYDPIHGVGTHIDLINGMFSFAGGNLSYDGSTLSITGDMTALNISGATITGGSLIGSDLYSNNWNAQTGAGCHIDLDDGTFSFADGDMTFTENPTTHVKTLNIKGNINASNISGSNIDGSTITGGTVTGTVINNGSGTFMVDAAGNLTATNATISGTIEGTILSGTVLNGTIITGGSINIGDGNFVVDSSGNVTCNYLYARGGKIGGCDIEAPTTPSGDGKLVVPASHLDADTVNGHAVQWQEVNFLSAIWSIDPSSGQPYDIAIPNYNFVSKEVGTSISTTRNPSTGAITDVTLNTENVNVYQSVGAPTCYGFSKRKLYVLCQDASA